jgi:DNA-binding PadR family transcriptional regulator
MAQSRDESPPSRIELVVLACLSQKKPPSDAALGEAVQQLALPDEPAEAARRRAAELLAELVRRGWVTSDDEAARQRKPKSARKLTDSGKRALRTPFRLSRAPTWAQVRDKYLPALALGLVPGSELAKKMCTENALTAAVLGARYGVRDAATPMAMCDALIADLLGMPRGKLTMDSIRVHVLLRRIDRPARDIPSRPAKGGYAPKLATWIACSTVGASGTQSKTARALAYRWVRGEAPPPGFDAANSMSAKATTSASGSTPPPSTVSVPPAGDARTPAPGLESPPRVRPGIPANEPTRSPPPAPPATPPSASNLLQVVREAIHRIGAEGRFGEKVYVSAIWRTIERDRKAGDLSLDHFKSWLVRANRDGWLVLARADLIGAMDAKQINESEINDRGATFHFVLDQRNGASVSQRESHAG